MQTKPTVTFLFIILASLGAWGVWKIVLSSGISFNSGSNVSFDSNENNIMHQQKSSR